MNAKTQRLSLLQHLTTRRTKEASGATTPALGSARRSALDWVVLVLLLLLGLLILKDAWLCDDAYITFRTVDNLVHGYGPTWNTDERVQTFTNPLWMLLLSALYFFVRNIALTSLLLSLTCAFGALYLIARKLSTSPFTAILALLALAASKTFVDFATSGLEDPLTYLLIALFAYVYFCKTDHPRQTLLLALLAGLATLNRMDVFLLFAPALAQRVYQQPTLKTLRSLVVGFAPFLLWEVFAVWYYGFPFPNTAYAKLNTSIPEATLLVHGMGYFIGSALLFDPMILLALLAGIVTPLIGRTARAIPLSLGMLLYTAYVVWIGGDFMAGRFLAAPLLVGVILVARLPIHTFRASWVVALAVVLLVGVFTPSSRWWTTIPSGYYELPFVGTGDERSYYASATSLWRMGFSPVPNYPWATEGLQARQRGQRVVVFGTIGFYGFNAGPTVHIVDPFALADPLLARLPARPDWQKIGHYARDLPPGYLATLMSGHNVIIDQNLALYYSKLEVATRGNLWSLERLVEIWKLNIGAYHPLLSGTAPLPTPSSAGPPPPVARIRPTPPTLGAELAVCGRVSGQQAEWWQTPQWQDHQRQPLPAGGLGGSGLGDCAHQRQLSRSAVPPAGPALGQEESSGSGLA